MTTQKTFKRRIRERMAKTGESYTSAREQLLPAPEPPTPEQEKTGRRPGCFIQVNIGDEPQKGGCPVAGLPAVLREAAAAALPVVGLMCLPPAEFEAAPFFALLARHARDHGIAGLSMGMSDDFETAVTIGATHVRVGTALFGGRA